jgi:hypothetical protein
MEEEEALQLRARLHIRSFWTLMRHGKYAHGIATLYDGFDSAVHRFSLRYAPDVPTEFRDWGTRVYKYLALNGLVTCDFDLKSFEDLLTRALEPDFDDMNPDFDFYKLWENIEKVFLELEILPFNPDILPEENKETKKIMGLE